jgi:glutamyl-tRNA synthetase
MIIKIINIMIKTRFPPEPSGNLHIGHIKAAYSNYKFAKDNNGEFMVRLDDTNPKNCKQEYVDNILGDLKLMNLIDENTEITFTSDYFDLLINYATLLIEKGEAYIDDLTKEEINYNRTNKISCKNRDISIEDNLLLWNGMIFGNNNYVLRIKIDMTHKNAVMRDPIIYRTCETKHYKSGLKYNIYPIYDFSCPILDNIEGITNTFRTSEYVDRNDLYYYILNILDLKRNIDLKLFSSLNFAKNVLSKRKIKLLIDNGIITGWNDPRLCTISGLIQRGFTVEGILEYIKGFYLSKVASKHGSYDILVSINNKSVDKIAGRYTVISKENVFVLQFEDNFDKYKKDVLVHPKNIDMGMRKLSIGNKLYLEGRDVALLKEGDEITLINFGNVIIKEINNNKILVKNNPEGDFKKTVFKLSWLDVEDCMDIIINEYGHLLKSDNVDFIDGAVDMNCINENSCKVMYGYGDKELGNIGNKHVQLLRRGYFKIVEGDGVVLNRLPDCMKVNHLSLFA